MIRRIRKNNGGYHYSKGATTLTGYPVWFRRSYNPNRVDNFKLVKRSNFSCLYNHWAIGTCYSFDPSCQTQKEALRFIVQYLKTKSLIKRLKPNHQ